MPSQVGGVREGSRRRDPLRFHTEPQPEVRCNSNDSTCPMRTCQDRLQAAVQRAGGPRESAQSASVSPYLSEYSSVI